MFKDFNLTNFSMDLSFSQFFINQWKNISKNNNSKIYLLFSLCAD